MRIWKWVLNVTDRQTIKMPALATLLSVQMQGSACCLWALCDPNAPDEQRTLAIYGTGNPMPDDPGRYIATFQMSGGELVFHVFDAT